MSSLPVIVALSAFSIVCALLAIACGIKAHTAEVRAIAEEQAERRRIEVQHAANVSARWQG